MTKAMLMRDTVTRVRKANEEKRIKEHCSYVGKLIDSKIHRYARKGLTLIHIKVKKKYSPILTKEQFEDKGFQVVESRKNGRAVLTVKW